MSRRKEYHTSFTNITSARFSYRKTFFVVQQRWNSKQSQPDAWDIVLSPSHMLTAELLGVGVRLSLFMRKAISIARYTWIRDHIVPLPQSELPISPYRLFQVAERLLIQEQVEFCRGQLIVQSALHITVQQCGHVLVCIDYEIFDKLVKNFNLSPVYETQRFSFVHLFFNSTNSRPTWFYSRRIS